MGDGGRHTAVSLPEDVVLEILVRVEDPAALFRCAVTCRQWSRLVADGSFLRRRWPDQNTSCARTPSAFVAGFFVRKRLLNRQYSETFFVPTPRSVLGPSRRVLGSFFPDAASLLDHMDVVPLTARRGLLLIRLTPRGNHPDSVLRLAVCNMLTGVCDALPPLECDWNFDRSGYAILTGADYSSNGEQQRHSAFFKVLIIDNGNIFRPLSLQMFSSQEARWSPPTNCAYDSMTSEGDRVFVTRPEAIVCNGMVHWIVRYRRRESIHFDTCTLDIDTETCYASLTRIEIPKENIFSRESCDLLQLVVTIGGRLSMFIQQNQGMRVVIWTRQNGGNGDGGSKWVHNRVVELKPPVGVKVLYLHNLNGKGGKLLVDDNRSNVYIVDLETGAMEKVAEWSDGWHIRQKGVLLEMDWPAFFASRLGNL